MKLFAVTGNPIAHSLSPVIHNAAFKAAGIDASYSRIAADSFTEALSVAREVGISGLNITAPLKEEAARAVDSLDDAGRVLNAINTVLICENGAAGFNTDPTGVTYALQNHLKGANALVIGAGGAGRAAAFGLLKEGAQVTIANRTVEKAKIVAEELGCEYSSLSPEDLKKVLATTSIIVSAITTTSKTIPEDLITKEMVILEGNYKETTDLVTSAKKIGAAVIDGREWLLGQGIAAFKLFVEKSPDSTVMKDVLSAHTPKNSNIILIGMMGSGKSEVGRHLAERKKKNFIDCDEFFCKKFKTSVADFINKFGEQRFRDEESVIIEGLKGTKNSVISTGGGAILSEGNRLVLKALGSVIWLWAPTSVLATRIKESISRPLLTGTSDISERLESLLQERRDKYFTTADIIVSTKDRSIDIVTDKIAHEVC